ncbi:MAG: hypothetical protein Q9226_001685 [Calogaya cf. arnoldii]
MAPFTHMGNALFEPDYSLTQTITSASPPSMTMGAAQRETAAPPSGPRPTYTSPRKMSLRPPPKDGEKVQPPEFYTVTPAVQPPTRPSLSSVSPRASIGGSSTSRNNSFQPTATQSRAQPGVRDMGAGSFDHPSGYKQNPYGAELTPEQRLATDQEDVPEYEQGLPMPNCTHSRKQSTASVVINYLPYLRRNTEDLFEGFQEWLSKNIL